MNFHSEHHIKHKIGLIYGLIDRAVKLLEPQFRTKNIKLVKNILRNKNYPAQLIDNIIKQRVHDIYNSIQAEEGRNKKLKKEAHLLEKTVVLPYVKGVTDAVGNLFRNFGLFPIYKVHRKLGSFFPQIKGPIPKEKQTGIIYKTPCGDCNGCYIGQTGRNLSTRIREHRRNYKEDPTRHTALTKHMLEHDHRFNYDRAEIIGKNRYMKNRLMMETFEI